MADASVIASLTSSMNSYYSAAAGYDQAADEAQGVIDNTLNPELEKKKEYKRIIDAASGRMGELDQGDETVYNDLSGVTSELYGAVEDSGAGQQILKINEPNAGHISDAKSAASAASAKLQQEIDELNKQIAAKQKEVSDNRSAAASARSSAAACSSAIAREQAS